MDTIPKLLDYQSQTRGESLAMRAKKLGLWESLSWKDTLREVQRFASGLAELGVVEGDTVAVIGGNTPRIFFAITACQSIGAIPAPIYGNLAGEELRHMLEKLASRYVVAQDQQQVDAVLGIESSSLRQEAIIYTENRGMSVYDRELVHDFAEIQQRGERHMSAAPSFYADKVAAGAPDGAAMILFTSGVVGHPKPAVLCHRHILSAARHVAELAQVDHNDEALSFMPIFLPVNLLSGYVLSHLTGMCFSCPENEETVLDNLREISPSVLYAPPHVYKQIYSKIRERIRTTDGLSKRLYGAFIDRKAGWPVLGNILIKSPIREMYGLNRLRLALAGGDAINADVFLFFSTLGVKVQQIYGTAETFGCIAMQGQDVSDSGVGGAVDQMEIKVSAEGEIMARGATVFSGYYQDEKLTGSVLDKDGWFRTGDIGSLSSDGRLTVAGRLDAVGKLKDGTVFMPKAIEREIKGSIYVNEVFVSGGGEQALVAIVTIENEITSAWADGQDVRYTGYTDLAMKPEVIELIGQEVSVANSRLPDGQPKVKSFVVFHRQFIPQTGELTWTDKIRRRVIQDRFKNMLNALQGANKNFEFDDPHSGNKLNFQIHNF